MANEEYAATVSATVIDFPGSRRGSGEPPGGDELEARVVRVESDMKEIKTDLKTLVSESAHLRGVVSSLATKDDVHALARGVSEMNGRLQMMPSAASFGELKGRVDSLPTTTKFATLLGIAVAIVTLIAKWPEISVLLGLGK